MTTSSEVSSDTATLITSSTASPRESPMGSPMGSAESATAAEGAGSLLDRKRIEEQLAQLERKRLELSRALVIADHPELADPIRLVEGRLYAVGRVEERMREGLSKAEARKVETLGKKRQALLAKKAELDLKRAELEAEVAGLDRELAALGEEREQAFVRERAEALEALVVTLAKVGPAFDAAAVEPTSLVPDLAARMDEIRATAQALAAGSVAPS
jgi:chromosome segregation ATPase